MHAKTEDLPDRVAELDEQDLVLKVSRLRLIRLGLRDRRQPRLEPAARERAGYAVGVA